MTEELGTWRAQRCGPEGTVTRSSRIGVTKTTLHQREAMKEVSWGLQVVVYHPSVAPWYPNDGKKIKELDMETERG